jgi:hypothetical protein
MPAPARRPRQARRSSANRRSPRPRSAGRRFAVSAPRLCDDADILAHGAMGWKRYRGSGFAALPVSPGTHDECGHEKGSRGFHEIKRFRVGEVRSEISTRSLAPLVEIGLHDRTLSALQAIRRRRRRADRRHVRISLHAQSRPSRRPIGHCRGCRRRSREPGTGHRPGHDAPRRRASAGPRVLQADAIVEHPARARACLLRPARFRAPRN